jgi:mannitol/fructose-specific phosphotransferase system IIA component (Ntr-type)
LARCPEEAGEPAEVGEAVNPARHLDPELILLELATTDPPEVEREGTPREKYVLAQKEKILAELVGLLARSGRVSNRNRLLVDLWNREKKASTGLKMGIALPHVRTSQVKECLFAFARSTPGLDFDCLDRRPAHLFFVLVTPPYDDTTYLRLYKQLATAFSFAGEPLLREFLAARDAGEILRAMRKLD